MAVSTMQSITGTGARNPFTVEFRPLGLFESKFYERPRKPYGSSCMNGHHFPRHKCIWRLPSDRNLNSKSKDLSLVLAIGKENVCKDTDDMYDELFNKYGKVVFRRKDQRPQSVEVDDDAESLSCKLVFQPFESKIT